MIRYMTLLMASASAQRLHELLRDAGLNEAALRVHTIGHELAAEISNHQKQASGRAVAS